MYSFIGVSFGFLSPQDKDTKSILHTKSNSKVKPAQDKTTSPRGGCPKSGHAGEGALSIHNSRGDTSVRKAAAMSAYKGFFTSSMGTSQAMDVYDHVSGPALRASLCTFLIYLDSFKHITGQSGPCENRC